MKKVLLILGFGFLVCNFCFAENLVNINTATLEELTALTGIGEVKAQAIIDARPYSSVDDLINVSGIGEKTLAKIKEQGLACVECFSNTELDSGLRQNDTETNSEEIASSPLASLETARNDESVVYPTGVLVNEILPSATGSDETGEWIEIYNSNNFEVNLQGWKIKDTAGSQTIYTIPQILPNGNSTNLPAYGILVFFRTATKITLNNDNDGVVLQNPNGEIASSTEFSKATKGQSWARFSGGWQWTATPTPGSVNSAGLKTEDSNGEKSLPKDEKSVNNTVAALSGANSDNNANQDNPWFLFLTAVALAIASAIIILFIKFKTNVRT